MSSSSWPPQLKAWVQDCLAKATPANKPAVNAELKQILFKAHADNTINTTDWTKVQLASLNPTHAVSPHIPSPSRVPPVAIPPPTTVPGLMVGGHRLSSPSPSLVSAYIPSVTPAPNDGFEHDASGKKKKKRKKNDALSQNGEAKLSMPSAYTFASAEDSEALARRAARFQQPKPAQSSSNGIGGMSRWFPDLGDGGEGSSMVPAMLGRKKMRGIGGLGYSGEDLVEVDPNVIDWDHYTIKGTSTKLEKSYLRLTSEPSPADIRPLSILKQTLTLLKQKWKQNRNYAYALDQFKSMRQDLTVQRIKNEFTVEVYEIHARIALEAKDLGEYNQCQTMLRQLYELGIQGHPLEFLSYRIIYLLHTRNRSDMAALLAQLTPSEKSDPGVHHALQVHASLATSNYVRFFRLFNSAPNMSGYIMDHFVERERMSALAVMSKAYMTLPLPHLTTTLAFDSDEEADAFLASHNAAVYTNVAPPPVVSGWKPIRAAPQTPLSERIWDCKKAHAACKAGIDKYRVVDLKGQVD